MSFIKKEFSNKKINLAGDYLITSLQKNELDWAETVLNNFRGIHLYPMNTFQATLRRKVKKFDTYALISQRLKRAPSIIHKLTRFKGMQLSRMQDIGGLRAVLSDIENVYDLTKDYKESSFLHCLVNEKDYIKEPKESGYRGIHLIYKYENPIAPEYNGLHLELQIRTKLQHIWATSVETMGTFLKHSLKSSEGPKEWLEFFALTSSAFAHIENCELIPAYKNLDKIETFKLVTSEALRLNVRDRFQGFRIAANAIHKGETKGIFHLIVLDLDSKSVIVSSFSKIKIEEANNEYSKVEERIQNGSNLQAVLVSTTSLDNLKKAYPSYFLDTADFLSKLNFIKRQYEKTVKDIN
ncbi:MAG: RelA/SpoT domain-containing protein [Candidatus Chryseobacterium colombiense]|nr:RelA/SpoT domain-containing protein [Chryseobacterium sp.]WEK69685.1 MAG: RelA/SpoT domain-containing protein [Chryseobacterium sp.]